MSDERITDEFRKAAEIEANTPITAGVSLQQENAALRAQLAEQEQRLAASEALLANVSQVHVGLVKLEQTTRGKIALSRLNTRRGVLEHQSTQATNMTDAYLAAVAQGWLPEPKKGA